MLGKTIIMLVNIYAPPEINKEFFKFKFSILYLILHLNLYLILSHWKHSFLNRHLMVMEGLEHLNDPSSISSLMPLVGSPKANKS